MSSYTIWHAYRQGYWQDLPEGDMRHYRAGEAYGFAAVLTESSAYSLTVR